MDFGPHLELVEFNFLLSKRQKFLRNTDCLLFRHFENCPVADIVLEQAAQQILSATTFEVLHFLLLLFEPLVAGLWHVFLVYAYC